MREANKAIMRTRHVTLTIKELVADKNGSTLFGKIDLRAGYHQLVLKSESRSITIFSSHCGQYRYKRLRFGVNSAAEIFQHAIQTLKAFTERKIADDLKPDPAKIQALHEAAVLRNATEMRYDTPYNFNMKYQPGMDNPARHSAITPNVSSCEEIFAEEFVNFHAVASTPNAITLNDVQIATTKNKTLHAIIQLGNTGRWHNIPNQLAKDVFICFRNVKVSLSVNAEQSLPLKDTQLVIPDSLQDQIIKPAHEGHQDLELRHHRLNNSSPSTMLLFTIVLLFLPVLCNTASDWDIFTFTQSWPPAVCIDGEEHHKCNIPSSVKTWTTHGLWPTKRGTEGPTNCNASWPFSEDDIKSLEPQMKKFWPNLYPDTKATDFWKHEWEKHGTCSTNLPAVHNEFLYFQEGLNLNRKYDIMGILQDKGIVPDQHAIYKPDQVLAALMSQLQVTPKVECVHDKITDTDVLYEVEICLDKNFNIVDCLTGKLIFNRNSSASFHHQHTETPSYTNCPKKGFLYLPLPNNSMVFHVV
ncbi:hypothetical protein ScPMuIL_013560 [Solemya velum]